ncbi:MAG: type II toxin-antitoxin system RelE/ParE family toxin [Pseudanabaena sp. CAN_BIN31]|nr:type II toxin-antitoxin system RelE/ParE family toxin [Pseudanabaena sp. CAN_BIN31]
MAIYKTRWFERWARKQGLTTQSLCAAVLEMTAGLYEADLGGGLLKKRVARAGQGKSGGFRTLVATNKGDRWIFVFGFSKNERANIDKREEEALKKLSVHLLSLSSEDLVVAQHNDELIEVICDEEINNS